MKDLQIIDAEFTPLTLETRSSVVPYQGSIVPHEAHQTYWQSQVSDYLNRFNRDRVTVYRVIHLAELKSESTFCTILALNLCAPDLRSGPGVKSQRKLRDWFLELSDKRPSLKKLRSSLPLHILAGANQASSYFVPTHRYILANINGPAAF